MSVAQLKGPRRHNEPKNRQNVYDYSRYLEAGKDSDLSIDYVNVGKDYVEEFKASAELHGKLRNNVAIEFLETWHPEELEKYGKEYLYELNRKNCEKMLEGYEYVRVPHLANGNKFHVHILVGAVHPENGKRLIPEFSVGTKWKKICDAQAKSQGLRTEKTNSRSQKQKLPKKARMMKRRGRTPRALQIMQGADVARRIATNMNEYKSILESLGFGFNDRGKALSYYHQGQEKAIRGRNLGNLYTKEELIEQFKRNEREFANRAEFKSHLIDFARREYGAENGYRRDATSFPFHPGGHEHFERSKGFSHGDKVANRIACDDSIYSNKRLSYYLVETVRECNSRSIVDYCATKGISLLQNKDGTYRLKGREHIEISDKSWVNNKSKRNGKINTQGTLIEFVANHKDLTVIGAMAEITGNKNLLLLESHLGRIQRDYKEFHIPRVKQQSRYKKESTLMRLAKHLGRDSSFAMEIADFKNVQVTTSGLVQLILGKNRDGSIDYKENSDGSWKKQSNGKFFQPFQSQKGKGKKATIYKDPFALMEKTKGKGLMAHGADESILVLGDFNELGIDLFIAEKGNIKSIELIGFNKSKVPFQFLDKYKKLGIEIIFSKSNGRSKEKDKGWNLPNL